MFLIYNMEFISYILSMPINTHHFMMCVKIFLMEADGDEFICGGLGGIVRYIQKLQKNYVKRSQFNTKKLKCIWG